MKFPSLLSACLCLCLCACRPTPPAAGQGHLQHGLALLENKQPEKAEAAFLQALFTPGEAVEAHFQLAQLYQREPDRLPLLVWHLQEFLQGTSRLDPRLPQYEPRLTAARQTLIQSQQSALRQDPEQKYRLQISLLEQSNADLNRWVERLNQENNTLRRMLLDNQKKNDRN